MPLDAGDATSRWAEGRHSPVLSAGGAVESVAGGLVSSLRDYISFVEMILRRGTHVIVPAGSNVSISPARYRRPVPMSSIHSLATAPAIILNRAGDGVRWAFMYAPVSEAPTCEQGPPARKRDLHGATVPLWSLVASPGQQDSSKKNDFRRHGHPAGKFSLCWQGRWTPWTLHNDLGNL